MTMTREFVDSLAVMDVMEDWGGNKFKISTKIANMWTELTDEEIPLALEALSICCPGTVFVSVVGRLGFRTDGMIPTGVGNVADYIEQVNDGQVRIRKERDPKSSKIFQHFIVQTIRNGSKFAVF